MKRVSPVGPSNDAVDFDFISILDFAIQFKGLQKRSQESRTRIVTVAREAFMARGYSEVSTHDISAEAGVTQGLITYHFKSKQGLWQAAMDRVFGEFRNNLASRIRSLRGADERTFMTEIVRHLINLERQYPFIMRFMVVSAKEADSHLIWLIKRHIQPIYDVLTHLFEVAQHHGIMRQLPVTNAYYVLLAAGTVFSLGDEISIVAGQDTNSDSFSDAQAECLITMLLTDPT
ncbi:TetR/AcrR family transcriptional regulator [Sphingorhabdus sp.]|uniref:TetR/AcrR family transcriptional regulator n=1 Tax=Sphingorhabdus sp. TaxID=1902408 RepID=UPI0037CA19AA